MPKQKRHKTDYPGVYYIETKDKQRIFYIWYYKDGKQIEEKAGHSKKDNMTAAKANIERGLKISGRKKSNVQKRKEAKAKKQAEASRWTIEKLFEEYKKNTPNRRDKKNDQSRFNNFIKPKFGNKEPQELLPLDVDWIRINLLKNKAPGTVKNILELLRRICNYGKKKRLCPGLSFTIQMPEVDNEKTEDLTPDQLARLFKAIEADEHPQAGNLMLMALYTGMRRGELFRLKWNDIDFRKGFITLRDPKGKKDQTIPLNDPARDLLKSHTRTESKYVFPGRSGNERTDIKKAVNQIKKKAGLPADFRPLHGLRHTFASSLASSGKVDMYHLQKLLTHKSAAMTQRYSHLRDESLKKASNLTVELFKPKAKAEVNETKSK